MIAIYWIGYDVTLVLVFAACLWGMALDPLTTYGPTYVHHISVLLAISWFIAFCCAVLWPVIVVGVGLVLWSFN